jgi:GNAT superfamily N-acetyltransferase
MPQWLIQRLDRTCNRTFFDCGVPQLNRWLQQSSSQYDKRDLARTYVALCPEEKSVVGFYSLSNHGLRFEVLTAELAQGLPRVDIPAVLLGQLAVDKSVQGRGLGKIMLIDAFRRVLSIANTVGVRGVVVDAIDENAVKFYKQYGFTALQDQPRRLLLPIQAIRKLGLEPY